MCNIFSADIFRRSDQAQKKNGSRIDRARGQNCTFVHAWYGTLWTKGKTNARNRMYREWCISKMVLRPERDCLEYETSLCNLVGPMLAQEIHKMIHIKRKSSAEK